MLKSICFLSLLSLFGCAGVMESRLDSVRDDFLSSEVVDKDFSNKDNLDLLLSADSLFHAGDFSSADAAYEEFNKRNTDVTRGSLLREVKSMAFGSTVNDYRPYMMDTLFVSYYQLWAALAQNRYDDARVIINQSYAKQQDMSRQYADTIESNQKKLSNNSELSKALTLDVSTWTAYRDIMNPALMYLSGIYFLNQGDFDEAETYLKRASGMAPNNSFVKSDLRYAENKSEPKNTVWVFIEDGFAPKLIEKRISLPIMSGRGASVVTVATSEPKMLNNFISIDVAQNLADVDSMFMTEYTEYRTNEALRAVSSAAARVALQSSAYNSHSVGSPVFGLLSTVYSEFTNTADVRTWATLPKSISVIRTGKNKSGLIELKSNDNLALQISVPDDGKNYLVYVRVAGNKYDTKIIKLKN